MFLTMPDGHVENRLNFPIIGFVNMKESGVFWESKRGMWKRVEETVFAEALFFESSW